MFFGIGQMHSCIEGVSNYKVGLSVKAGQDYGLIAKEKPHYDKRSSCHRSISCTMEQPLQPLAHSSSLHKNGEALFQAPRHFSI